MFSIVQPFNREGKSCEKCIKRPGCSEHGSCINTYGTSDTSDDMMEALACHCTDPSKWTGALCDKGELDMISILRLTPYWKEGRQACDNLKYGLIEILFA